MKATQHALEVHFKSSQQAAIKSGLCKAFEIPGTLSLENAGVLLELLTMGHLKKMSAYEERLICELVTKL